MNVQVTVQYCFSIRRDNIMAPKKKKITKEKREKQKRNQKDDHANLASAKKVKVTMDEDVAGDGPQPSLPNPPRMWQETPPP